jgi:hypothetical protein
MAMKPEDHTFNNAHWQIEEIKRAVREADRGEFASDEQVERTLRKFTGSKPLCTRPGRKAPPKS